MMVKLAANSKVTQLSAVPENGLIIYEDHFGMSGGLEAAREYNGELFINVRWVSDHHPKYGNSTDLPVTTMVEFITNLSQT